MMDLGTRLNAPPCCFCIPQGDNAYFNFYDADEWERLEIGVFSPEYDNILTDERRKV